MLPQYHKMWEIVEEPRFERELKAIEADAIRADEFVDGAKAVLARNPQIGTKVGERVWFLPMARATVAIYYTFDDTAVYLQSIQVVPEPEE